MNVFEMAAQKVLFYFKNAKFLFSGPGFYLIAELITFAGSNSCTRYGIYKTH